MFRFILMRTGGLIGVLLAVSLLTFFLMHMVPGGPFDAMTVQTAQMIPKELVENLEKLYEAVGERVCAVMVTATALT